MSETSSETLAVIGPERFSLEAVVPFTDQLQPLDRDSQEQAFRLFTGLVRNTAFDERFADRLITTIDQENQMRFWDVWLVSNIGTALRPLLWNIVVTQHEYTDISTSSGKEVCGVELWGAAGHDVPSERYHHYYMKGGDANVYRQDRQYTERGCEKPTGPNDRPVGLREIENVQALLAGARLL